MRGAAPLPVGGNDFPRTSSIPPPGSAASAAVAMAAHSLRHSLEFPSTVGMKKMRGSAPLPAGGNDFPRTSSIPPPGSAASAAVAMAAHSLRHSLEFPSTVGMKKMRGSAPLPAGGNDFPRAPSIPPPYLRRFGGRTFLLGKRSSKNMALFRRQDGSAKIFFAPFCTFFAAFRHKLRREKQQRLFLAVWPFSKTVSETPSFDGLAQGAIMAVSRACRACAFLSSVADVAVRNCPRQESLSA